MTTTLDGPRAGAASGNTTSLAVLLHGYGADGDDLFGLAEPLSQVLPDTAFASPNAPQRNAMNPMGRQWFPIPFIDGSSAEAMAAGFAEAVVALNGFLDAEMARYGLDESRTALIGFSQGTMMSLEVGPRRQTPLAGVVGFSGRLLEPERLAQEIVSKPPVLLVHGDRDEVLPVTELDAARDGLAAAGIAVRWRVARGVGHGISPEGLQLAAGFLRDVLAA